MPEFINEPITAALARALHPASRAMTRTGEVLVDDPLIRLDAGVDIFEIDDVPANQRPAFISYSAACAEDDPETVELHINAWAPDYDTADRMAARIVAVMRSTSAGAWRHVETEFVKLTIDADAAIVHVATVSLTNGVAAV